MNTTQFFSKTKSREDVQQRLANVFVDIFAGWLNQPPSRQLCCLIHPFPELQPIIIAGLRSRYRVPPAEKTEKEENPGDAENKSEEEKILDDLLATFDDFDSDSTITPNCTGVVRIFDDSLSGQREAIGAYRKGDIAVVVISGNIPLLQQFKASQPIRILHDRKADNWLPKLLKIAYGRYDEQVRIASGGWLNRVTLRDFPVNDDFLSLQEIADTIYQSVSLVIASSTKASPAAKKNYAQLDSLPGLGEARVWAEQLVSDVSSAIAGEIGWEDVDRGALLAGPPGTGKTSLAKAIGQQLRIPVLATSYAQWHRGNKFDAVLNAMHSFFDEARKSAPCIVFIDEMDSFGDRTTMTGQNKLYEADMLNALLEQLDGFQKTAGVVVLAATNHPEDIDPALRRPGRLDRLVNLAHPDANGRREILAMYLRGTKTDLTSANLFELAKSMGSVSGAELEQLTRDARRLARKEKKPIDFDIMIKAVLGNCFTRLEEPLRTRVATLLAGHLVASATGQNHGKDINFVAVDICKPPAAGVFNRDMSDAPAAQTQSDLDEELEWLLAGRAAEEMLYGKADVSTISSNKLNQATTLAWHACTTLGMGKRRSLLATGGQIPFHAVSAGEVEEMLDLAFDKVSRRLAKNEQMLREFQQWLLRASYLTGTAIREHLRSTPAISAKVIPMASAKQCNAAGQKPAYFERSL